jgi:hypothetical protein
MHMAWMRQICGRIKSDYRYSNVLVYNNFPFPENVSDKDKKNVEEKARQILSIRDNYPDSSLADLYNSSTMPKELLKSHEELDKAVDKCYGKQIFNTEMERLRFLFGLYEKHIAGLFAQEKKKKITVKPK